MKKMNKQASETIVDYLVQLRHKRLDGSTMHILPNEYLYLNPELFRQIEQLLLTQQAVAEA